MIDGTFNAPIEWHPWILQIRTTIIPQIRRSVPYDLKADPLKFLTGLCHLHKGLNGNFRVLPLRTSNIPGYVSLDITALRALFGVSTGKNKTPDDQMWSMVFNMRNRVFRMKNCRFRYLTTDGVGVSLIFEKIRSIFRVIDRSSS